MAYSSIHQNYYERWRMVGILDRGVWGGRLRVREVRQGPGLTECFDDGEGNGSSLGAGRWKDRGRS